MSTQNTPKNRKLFEAIQRQKNTNRLNFVATLGAQLRFTQNTTPNHALHAYRMKAVAKAKKVGRLTTN